MRIVSEAEASKDLKALLDHVVGDADITVITRLEDKAAIVMGRDHYNSLMETLYLLAPLRMQSIWQGLWSSLEDMIRISL